jgi:hypothetical protein
MNALGLGRIFAAVFTLHLGFVLFGDKANFKSAA